MNRRVQLWWVVLVLAVAATGCKRTATPAPETPPTAGGSAAVRGTLPNPVPVGELIVRDLTPEELHLSELSGALEGIVRASFAKSPRVTLPATNAPDAAYSMGVGVACVLVNADGLPLSAPAKGTMIAVARVELGRSGGGGLPEEYTAPVEMSRPYDPAADGALDALCRTQVAHAVDEARDRLVALLRVAESADDGVAGLLADADPFVRAAAAREAGERRLKAAAAALVAALKDADANVRHAAVGALGRIRDASTIPAVAALTSGMDHDEIRLAVYALGDIGGPEARKYLMTIADSHPMEDIRAAAQETLARGEGGER